MDVSFFTCVNIELLKGNELSYVEEEYTSVESAFWCIRWTHRGAQGRLLGLTPLWNPQTFIKDARESRAKVLRNYSNKSQPTGLYSSEFLLSVSVNVSLCEQEDLQ